MCDKTDEVPGRTPGAIAQGCAPKPGKGDHEKWYCPCGRHQTVTTRPGNVSPGVVRSMIQQLPCLPKGWLQ